MFVQVSVIIPIYNVEVYLERCLKSIQNQSFKDFEVLMINDGSPDHCDAICKRFAENDPRFKYFAQKNQGVSAARNLGLDNVNGEYVVFVDSDDWVEEDYLSDFVRHSSSSDTLLIQDFIWDGTTNRQEIDLKTSRQFSLQNDFGDLTKNDALLAGYPFNKFYSRRIIQEHELRFNTKITHREDEIFFQQYLRHISDLLFLPSHNYHYLFREGSAMCRYPGFNSEYDFLVNFIAFIKYLDQSVADKARLHAYKVKKLNLYYKYLLYTILYHPSTKQPRTQRIQDLKKIQEILAQINPFLNLTLFQTFDRWLITRRLYSLADLLISFRRKYL